LAFSDIAKRLHPADVGFAVAFRGTQLEDVEAYALSLESHRRSLVSAIDPQLESLPPIAPQPTETDMGGDFPEFRREVSDSITYKQASATWCVSRDPSGAAPNFLDGHRRAAAQTRLAQERVANIAAAWRTEAYQWYGRNFSLSTLRAICGRMPQLVESWAEPALGDGPTGLWYRVRFGGFLGKLCPALLEHEPELGFRLWRALRDETTGIVNCDTAYVAFAAPDNYYTQRARWEVIANAMDDFTLSRVSELAEGTGHDHWLRQAVTELIREPALWKRAKGLTLAAHMDTSISEFLAYQEKADVAGTWVEDRARWLQSVVQKHQFAKYWFHQFITADDADVSWGAWQMMLLCGDERLLLPKIFGEVEANPRAKQRFLLATAKKNGPREHFSRERERKETLFGIRIDRGEIVPFL
jgi:hypothetical protein